MPSNPRPIQSFETTTDQSHRPPPSSSGPPPPQTYRLPPPSDEIAEPDSDPDINEVNHLLADLAFYVRWYHGAPNNPRRKPTTSDPKATPSPLLRRKSKFDARAAVGNAEPHNMFEQTQDVTTTTNPTVDADAVSAAQAVGE